MLSASNGHAKSNGRVSPMDEETIERMGKQEIKNTNLLVPEDPVEPTPTVVKKSFIARLFKKEQQEKKEVEEEKKKPDVPKLKSFEIVRCH